MLRRFPGRVLLIFAASDKGKMNLRRNCPVFKQNTETVFPMQALLDGKFKNDLIFVVSLETRDSQTKKWPQGKKSNPVASIKYSL